MTPQIIMLQIYKYCNTLWVTGSPTAVLPYMFTNEEKSCDSIFGSNIVLIMNSLATYMYIQSATSSGTPC